MVRLFTTLRSSESRPAPELTANQAAGRSSARCWAVLRRARRGFSLLTTTVCLTVMVGMLGLALDLGRMYIAKNELQAFVDAAALAAAYELDGTPAGVTRANNVARTGPGTAPNRWHYGTENADTVRVDFSTVSNGGWVPATGVGAPANVRFVRVLASGDLPLTVMRVFNIGSERTMRAVAFAGQAEDTTCGSGCAPFSPDAPDAANMATFGFTPGQLYAIKWAPHGQRKHGGLGMCQGDELAGTPNPPGSDRGYIDVGQGNGNSSLHEAIVNQDFPAVELEIGDFIDVVPGNKHVGPAVSTRFAQDTDQTSATYSAYLSRGTGNGRRLLTVPINNPATNRIIGFGTFFMQSNPRGVCAGNSDACCAEFVVPNALAGGDGKPASTEVGALYRVRLFGGGL